MNRRHFIKTGLIFVPTWFVCKGGAASLSSLHPSTFDWMTRVRANSGSYSGLSVVASDIGYKMIDAYSLRSRLLRLNFFFGNTSAAGLVPHIKDIGATVDTKTGASDNTGMAYQETSQVTAPHGGFLPQNSAVDFVSTTVVPSSDMSSLGDDSHLGIYSGGASGAEAAIPIGVALTDAFYLTTSYTALGQVATIYTGTGRPVNADTNGIGFYIGTRVGSGATDVKIYKNGAATGSSSSVGGAISNINVAVYVGAANAGGGGPIGQSLGHWMQGYSIGKSLDATQALNLSSVFIRLQQVAARWS